MINSNFYRYGRIGAIAGLLLALFAPPAGFSQTALTGGLRGGVTDSSGAVVPGATVKITNSALSVSRETVSGANGQFSVSDLTPSEEYGVTVSAVGFRPFEQSNVTVAAGVMNVFNASLSVAGTVEEVEVRAIVRREELASTGATIIENNDLTDRVFFQPLDMIKLSPGVSVTQYGENGIAPDFQIRGSKGGHGGGDITMYIDGIPLHDNGHATAYLDTGIVMPIEVESVEVIKGPASVYYGSRAAGGALPIQTIKGGNQTRLNLRYGNHNNFDASGLLARENGRFSQVYSLELFHTDGWRDHSDWDKKNFSGRWGYKFTDKFTASLNLRAYQAEWNSAGYIPYRLHLPDTAAVDDGSGQYNGGKRSRYDGRLWANYFINKKSQLTYYIYGTTLDHTRWQLSGYPDNATGPGTGTYNGRTNGTEQTNTHNSWGTGLNYNFKGSLADRDFDLTFGAGYSREAEEPNQRYALHWRSGRTRFGLNSDSSYSITNPFVLGEAFFRVLSPLKIRLGGRYDWQGGDYTNNVTGVTSSAPTYNFFSPKVGLTYDTPLNWLTLYANFGRGFSMPGLNAASSGFYNGNTLYDLKTRDQYEIGSRIAPAEWISLETTYFWAFTKNDVVYDEATETTNNVGKTKREGLETAVAVRPFTARPDLTLTGSYSYLEARNTTNMSTSTTISTKGRRITGVPRQIVGFEIAYEPSKGLGGRLSYRAELDNLVSDPPPVRIDGSPNLSAGGNLNVPFRKPDQHATDLLLSYRLNRNYRLSLNVLNLFNQRFNSTMGAPDVDTGDYTYARNQPRTGYLSLEWKWD